MHNIMTTRNMNSSSKAHTHDSVQSRSIPYDQQYCTRCTCTPPWPSGITNYLIYTDAGKLIFSRYGDEAGLATICGIFQTLCAVINDDNLGEVHCINTFTSKLVFMSVGSITLVAIAYKDSDGQCDTIDHLRLQLECLYSAIIFTLSDAIQYMLQSDPQLDLVFLLGSSHEKLNLIMDDLNCFEQSQSTRRKSCCWVGGGVDIIGPIPTEVRNYTSIILATECSKNKSIIYGILSIGQRLFNIIQPHQKEQQLSPFDLNILMYFLDNQILITESELWFPICLPRLSQSAFVNCFQCCIGELGMRLTLISQQPSLEEFKSLQSTANSIKASLGMKSKSSNNRVISHVTECKLDGYIREQGDMRECQTQGETIPEEIMTVKEKRINQWRNRFSSYLSSCIKKALDEQLEEEMMQNYCNMSSLIHFTFRYAVPIRHCNSGAESNGKLIQSFGPQLSVEGYNLSEKKIWIMYQRLGLRLNVGTESVEDILNMYDTMCVNNPRDVDATITRHRPSQIMHEETSFNNRTNDMFLYTIDGDELYVAQRGQNYDFYAVFPTALSSIADAKILSSTLVETLLHKSDDLQFLSFL